jgi:hypothetical protein
MIGKEKVYERIVGGFQSEKDGSPMENQPKNQSDCQCYVGLFLHYIL